MGTVDLVIKNAKVYFSGNLIEGGIAADEGSIVSVGRETYLPRADRTIEAKGRVLIPGAIDGHVHIREPWEREDRNLILSASDVPTDTRAAAVGGVTTVINQPNVQPPITDSYSLKLEAKTWENRSYVDYGFHGGLRPMTSDEEIERLWSDGVFGLKTFLASPDLHWPSVSDGDLLRILRKTAEIDALLVIHAENESMLSVNMKRLKDLGRKDYASHLEWRPPVAEVEAVRRSVFLLSQAGSRGLIAHASVAESIIEVRDAKNRGNRIYVETCPQYLFLSDEDLKARGPWLKCAPPLRSREESSELWRLLNSGWIDVLASDHAPHPRELKEEGLSDMWKAPNGLPGIETSLPLMLTAVKNGNLSLSILVKTFSENPAKLYGIYPRKGTIAVGSDADLVLVDFDKSERISSDRLEMKCGWSPYEGFELKGLPVMTVVRGEVVMEDREVVGVEGHGIHIRRNFHVPKK